MESAPALSVRPASLRFSRALTSLSLCPRRVRVPGRVYQQCLILLSLAAVQGTAALGRVVGARAASPRFRCALVLAAYLAVTPLLTQLAGSGYANMQLDNYGPYYAVYYTHNQELRATQWLSQNGEPGTPTYADWFGAQKTEAFSQRQIWVIPNVVPGNITRQSYIFADDTNIRDGTAYGLYNGGLVDYPFPHELFDAKDVLFSASDVNILR